MKIEDRVRDRITGFTGVITGEAHYVNGAHQFLVSPSVHPVRGYEAPQWFEAGRLEPVPDEDITYTGNLRISKRDS